MADEKPKLNGSFQVLQDNILKAMNERFDVIEEDIQVIKGEIKEVKGAIGTVADFVLKHHEELDELKKQAHTH